MTVIIKCDRNFFQIVTDIAKCDKQSLQSLTGMTICGNYYKVRRSKGEHKFRHGFRDTLNLVFVVSILKPKHTKYIEHKPITISK